MTRLRKAFTHKPLDNPSGGWSSKERSEDVPRKDVNLHKRAFEDLEDGTVLKYRVKGKTLLVGYKQGSRICCDCCNTEFSASKFEAHANRAAHKKPYGNIYTPEGVSLHELAMKSDKDRECSQKSGDGLCCLCSNGGSDLRCSECSKTFHKKCASVTDPSMRRWYCRDCRRKINREKFAKHDAANNAIAKQSTTSPVQTVYNPPSQWSTCFLCSCNDFLESGFGPRTIIFCDQCEKEYHIGCLERHKMANLKEMPGGEWFCSTSCGKVHCELQKLVEHGDIELTAPFLELIHTKSPNTDSDVNCRLFRGKIDSFEAATMLTQALAIFHDCFGSLTFGDSGEDIFDAMVFWGLKDKDPDPDYHGMFCIILSVNSKAVCAAILRVFGVEIAELPFVATSRDNRGKGYLKTMLGVIEYLLASLEVQTLVLPSTAEARPMWTDHFGFAEMTAEQVRELKRAYFSVVQLPGTTMMSKSIS